MRATTRYGTTSNFLRMSAYWLRQPATADVWRQLTGHSTSQTITIENATVPAAWEDAVAQDRSATLIDGMTAVTIDATRHRAGGTSEHEMTSDHPVAFTVFLACQPAFDRCHVLRLSELDNPLR